MNTSGIVDRRPAEYVPVEQIMELAGVSRSRAYEIIRQLGPRRPPACVRRCDLEDWLRRRADA